MVKTKQEKPESEDAIIKRMNKALKRMMSTPHETQKEMIERRRQGLPPLAEQREADIERRKKLVPASQPKRK